MKTSIELIILIAIIPATFLSGCGGNSGTTDGLSTGVSLSDVASLIKEDSKVRKGNITGVVDSRLLASMHCTGSKAVYIFLGHDTPPDDIDKSDPNPVKSVNVEYDSISGRYRYNAYSLTEDRYSLALTCQADRDSPVQDDDIRFGGMKNVTVSGGRDIIAHLFI
jgi:hypothetical protein